MHLNSPLLRAARRARTYLAALAALSPVLALASASALAEPDSLAADSHAASAGSSGLAGSGSGGAAGSDGGLGGGSPGAPGRGGASPLGMIPSTIDLAVPVTAPEHAHTLLPQTTLRRDVHPEDDSVQALGDPNGSLAVPAPTADLMVTANGSCSDEADQVGVTRNPRDRSP